MANKKAQILSLLRRFSGSFDIEGVVDYLSNFHRQNLKTLEYWNDSSTKSIGALNEAALFSRCEFDVGATGAVNLNATASPDIKKMVRVSAGYYQIFFKDSFTELKFVDSYFFLVATAGSPSSTNLVVRSVEPSLNMIAVAFLNGIYAGTDVAAGTTVGLRFYLNRN